MAPTSAGADADADHESAAGRGDERRLSLEEKAVQRKRTRAARETPVGSLGQSASERIIGAAGPAGSKNCGVNGSGRARSQETARGAAVDDASWRGTHTLLYVRVNHFRVRLDTGKITRGEVSRRQRRSFYAYPTTCRVARGAPVRRAHFLTGPS